MAGPIPDGAWMGITMQHHVGKRTGSKDVRIGDSNQVLLLRHVAPHPTVRRDMPVVGIGQRVKFPAGRLWMRTRHEGRI